MEDIRDFSSFLHITFACFQNTLLRNNVLAIDISNDLKRSYSGKN
jgi:hypothetical protein